MVRAADLDQLLEKGAAAVRPLRPHIRGPARRLRAPQRAAAPHRSQPHAHCAPNCRSLPARLPRPAPPRSRAPTRAPQFDKLENKPVVIGYGVGLLVGLYFVESLIHLPVLNLVIGFPLELLGVMSAGALALRYLKQGGDAEADLSSVAATCVARSAGRALAAASTGLTRGARALACAG